MRSTFQHLLRSLFLASLMLALAPAVMASTYAVVVNAQNPFSGDDEAKREIVKHLYLKEQSSWPGGIDAVPFGRADGSPEQLAFEKTVLGMSPGDIESHWLKLKQMSGETPPRGIGSVRILGRQIGKHPGAFGVVLASEAAGIEGGKVLFEFDAD